MVGADNMSSKEREQGMGELTVFHIRTARTLSGLDEFQIGSIDMCLSRCFPRAKWPS